MDKEPETEPGTPQLTEELIYEHIKEAPQQQVEFANQLDDKILRIFGAATIVMGLLGLSTIDVTGRSVFFIVLPLVPYGLSAFWTLRCIRPATFHLAIRAGELPKFWEKKEEDVRRALIGEIGRAYLENEPILKEKAWYIRWTLIATAGEVGLVVAALILYRLS